MREFHVYADVILENVATVGYCSDTELLLCTIVGNETALIKSKESSLYYLVEPQATAFEMLRLNYLSTVKAGKQLLKLKQRAISSVSTAYLPSGIVLKI